MNRVLTQVYAAHGGLGVWQKFKRVSATIVTGGGLWPMKGLIQDATPREMTVSCHEQQASVSPFGRPDWRTNFRPERIAIESLTGSTVSERLTPRASFAGHALNTSWDSLHRAYFNGYALWTYLTTPFHFSLPGFEINDIAPWKEGDEIWHGLNVRAPEGFAGHSRDQQFYFGDDYLLRRHDYVLEVAGYAPVAQYVWGITEFQGVHFPTKRRAYLRGPDGKPIRDMLMVAIDLSNIRLE